MKKIFTLCVLMLFAVVKGWAQPTVLGTDLVNGSYVTYNLNTVGVFKQYRLQATSSASISSRQWQFTVGTAASPDYNTNWRPNTSNNTLSPNIFIPTTYANGAKYNTATGPTNGGAPGLLPVITSGNYYTFNVSNNSAADNVMQLLETSFNPVTVSSVTQAAGTYGSRTVTITTSATPASGENIYVRYSTNSYSTSTLVQATGSGTTWTATIPWQSSAVSFYVYTSNKILSAINADVTSYGQSAHDMSTLNLNNNSGANYAWTPATGPIVVTSTGGSAANTATSYSTFTTATSGLFAVLNGGTVHTGTVTVLITADITSEPGYNSTAITGMLNNSTVWTSLGIQPSGARTISGAATNDLFRLNGADNVTIDGLNTGGNSLTISNTTVGSTAQTVDFLADATNNTIQNCTVLGANSSNTAAGTIVFGTGTSTGNDGNVLNANFIGPVNASTSTPTIAIWCNSGTNTYDNSGISITNNYIYDYYSSTYAASGIRINSGFTTGANTWTITGNRFYQTVARTSVPGVTSDAIEIKAGSGYTISNNIIGFASPTGTGTTAYSNSTLTAFRFIGIDFEPAGTATNSLQGNTIAGFSMSTSSGAGTSTTYGIFSGIYLSVPASSTTNIGTITGNTIGSITTAGSINISSSTSLGLIAGINVGVSSASTSILNIQNNTVSSFITGGAATIGYVFRGIAGIGSGTFNIQNNTIGNANATNSVIIGTSGTTAACSVTGIYTAATGAIVIGSSGAGNTIQNVTNNTSNASSSSFLYGIYNFAAASNLNINYNIFSGNTTSAIGATGYFLYGAIINAGTVTGAISLSNNTINSAVLSGSAVAGSVGMIANLAAGTTSSVSINSNSITGVSITGATAMTDPFYAVYQIGTPLTENINSNNFNNLTVKSAGAIYLIDNDYTTPANGTKTIQSNYITTGFTRNGAGAGSFFGYYDNSSSPTTANHTISGNNFSNINTGSTNSGSNYGIFSTDYTTNSPINVYGNIVSNNSFGTGTTYGIYVSGFAGTSASPNALYNNTVASNTSAGSLLGIYIGSNSLYVDGYSNTVNALSTSASAGIVTGMVFNGATNLSRGYKNKVYDISCTGTAGASVAKGIDVVGGTSTSTLTLYNNLIGDIKAATSTQTSPAISVAGLSISVATGTVNVYYNTIYLNAAAGGTNFGSAALYANTGATVTLINNILVNNSVANGSGKAVAYQRSTPTTSTYSTSSNKNDFFGTTGVYFDGTNTYNTLSSYKSALSSWDQSSVSENPTFLSTTGSSATYLHINTAIATQLESGGGAISGITDDYDGDIRFGNSGYAGGGSAPDIGADEFTGILSDVSSPTIASVIASTTCANASTTISATITDVSGVPTSGIGLPRLYYRTTTSGAYTAVPGVYTSNNIYTFTFNAGISGGTVYYYIAAQDNVSTPNVGTYPSTGASGFASNPPAASTPPTTPATFNVLYNLSGIYTVGAGGNFTTLTAAVNAYNTACAISNNVVFSLTDATYSTAETFPITINANSVNTSNYTLTIRPAAGAAPSITSSNATGTILLNGADYIIFDGRPDGTGTPKTLNIINTSTSGYVIGLDNDATFNKVQYCTIKGVNTSASAGNIYFGATAPSTGNDNNTIDNNDILAGATTPLNSIYSLGSTSSATQYNSSNIISNNNIADFWLLGNGAAGVSLNAGSSIWTISGNSFYQTSARNATSGTNLYPIDITTSGSTFTISNNYIGGQSANAGGSPLTVSGAFDNQFVGIYLSTATSSANSVNGNTIANIAFQSTISGTTTSPFFGVFAVAGNNSIGNTTKNIIGSQSATDNIVFTQTSNTGGNIYGIYSSSTGTNVINSNEIGGITLTSNTANTIVSNFYGIRVVGGTNTISANKVGGTVSNSIQGLGGQTATANAAVMYGISGNTGTNTITSNIVRNIVYPSGGASTSIAINGISFSGGSNTITSNTISALSSVSGNAATGTGASVIGIADASSGTSESITLNTISSLSNSYNGTSSTLVNGISISAGSGTIYKNTVYGVSNSSTGTNPFATGLFISSTGTWTIANNMFTILNGGLTNGMQCAGVYDNSTGTTNYFYNTLYVGGTQVSSTQNSVAYQRASSATVTLRNNILDMQRSGGTGNTGKFYGIANTNSTPATGWSASASNNNVINSSSASTVGLWGPLSGTANDRTFVQWQAPQSASTPGSGGDANSYSGISIPYTNTNTGNLHINSGTSPIILESNGVAVTITDDIDGQTRPGGGGTSNGGGSKPDIGADEFDGVPVTPPTVTLNTGITVSCATATSHTVSVNVVAGTGTVSSVTLSYNTGSTSGTVAMTLISGTSTSGIWSGTIPAGTAGTAVSWSVTAINTGGGSATYIGTSYTDGVVAGITGSATANPTTVCSGVNTILTGTFITNNGSGTIGTGATISSSSSSQGTIFPSYFGNGRQQYIILASEMTAQGFVAGNITSVNVNVSTVGTPAILTGYTMKMANTTASSFASTVVFLAPSFTTVYPATSTTVVAGLNTLNFTTPFAWDGTSNIVVEICYGAGTAGTSSSTMAYTTTASYLTATYTSDVTAGCGQPAGSRILLRPNMTFVGKKTATLSSYTWLYGATTIGTGNPLTYAPTNATGTAQLQSYKVVGTDAASGCTVTSTPVDVTVNPNQTIALTSAAGTNSQSVCSGSTITNITYSVGGGGTGASITGGNLPSGFTGAYNNGVFTISGSTTVTTTTNYNYTVTTTGTCTAATATGTVTVNPLPVAYNFNGTSLTSCANNPTAELILANSQTGVNYQLYNNNVATGSPLPGTTGSQLSFGKPTVSGTYTVIGTYTTTQCTAPMTGSVTLTVITINNYTVSGSGVTCGTGSIVLNGSQSGVTYQLVGGTAPNQTGNGSSLTFTVTQSGTYFINASAGSCSQTMNSNTGISVTVNPVPSITGTYKLSSCSGSPFSTTPSSSVNGTTYTWSAPTPSSASITGGSGQTGQSTVFGTLANSDIYLGTATYTVTPSANGCTGTSFTVIDTVAAAMVGTQVTAPSGAICSGSAVNIDFSGAAGSTVYYTVTGNSTQQSVTLNAVGNYSLTVPNITQNTTFQLVSATSGTRSSCTQPLSGSAVVNLSTNVLWTGNAGSTLWNNGGNWCSGSAPNSGVNVTIGSTNGNYPTLPSNITVANLTINANNTVTLGGFTLTAASISGTGTLSSSATSNLVVNGASTLYFTTGANTLHDLTIGGNGTVTLGNALDITDGASSGTVTVGTNAILATGDVLTLKSGSAGTAAIGVNTSGSNYITGKVIIERFTDAKPSPTATTSKRAWRLVTSPVTGQSIHEAWQENANSNADPNHPYGTIITGYSTPDAATAAAQGYDWLGAGLNSSIRKYVPATDSWTSLATPGTLATLHSEQAFLVFVRGDRSILTGAGSTSTPANLRSKGNLVLQGATTVGYGATTATTPKALVGNPYASAINFGQFITHNTSSIKDQFTLWNSTLGVYGAYVLVDRAAPNGNYRATPDPFNSTVPTQNDDSYKYIPSGSGFIVYPQSAAAGSVSFEENDKAPGQVPPVNPFRVVNAPTNVRELVVNLNLKDSLITLADGFRAKFSADYEGNEDDNSTGKSTNFYENLGLTRNSTDLIIEARGEVKKTDTLYMKLWNVVTRNYQFQVRGDNFVSAPGIRAWLEDGFLHTKQELALDGSVTTINFAANKSDSSAASDRFRIVFENNSSALPVTITKVTAQPKNGGVEVGWTVTNETNVKGYTIEKSNDGGRTFTSMGTQQPARNNPQAAVTSYSGYDAAPKIGDNHYRIRIEAKDGTVTYSTVVKVTIGQGGSGIQITLYPNPVREGKANLKLTNLKEGAYLVGVYSGSGQTVFQKKVYITLANTTQTETLVIGNNLAQGSYQVKLTDSKGTVIFTDQLIVGR